MPHSSQASSPKCAWQKILSFKWIANIWQGSTRGHSLNACLALSFARHVQMCHVYSEVLSMLLASWAERFRGPASQASHASQMSMNGPSQYRYIYIQGSMIRFKRKSCNQWLNFSVAEWPRKATQISRLLGVPTSKLPLVGHATEADRGVPFAFKRLRRGADEKPGTSQQRQEPPEPQLRMRNQIPAPPAITSRIKRKMPMSQACARKEPTAPLDVGEAHVKSRELAVWPCSPVLYNPPPCQLPLLPPLSWTCVIGPTLMLFWVLWIRKNQGKPLTQLTVNHCAGHSEGRKDLKGMSLTELFKHGKL